MCVMNNKIMSGTLLVLLSLLVGIASAQEELKPCAVEKDKLGYDRYICPEGLGCISFSGIGLRCAPPNPCSYFRCPDGTTCVVAESYPPQVFCTPCYSPDQVNRGATTDSRDLTIQTEKLKKQF